jgi:hypothetical protein
MYDYCLLLTSVNIQFLLVKFSFTFRPQAYAFHLSMASLSLFALRIVD